jgi:hypothetical protein
VSVARVVVVSLVADGARWTLMAELKIDQCA